jgi:hypothetical protein
MAGDFDEHVGPWQRGGTGDMRSWVWRLGVVWTKECLQDVRRSKSRERSGHKL